MAEYASASAFREAALARLRERALAEGTDVQRLQRIVMVERVLARLTEAQPGRWVLKGGMALEARLGPGARATRDLDVGMRPAATGSSLAVVGGLLEDALDLDLGDWFRFVAHPIERMALDRAGDVGRAGIEAWVGDRLWGRLQLDIAVRSEELHQTDAITLRPTLLFAGIDPPTVEVVSAAQHAAEKFHAMLKRFGDRENTRVRDLVDIVLMLDVGLIAPDAVRDAVVLVFDQRGDALPLTFPGLPPSWAERYHQMARDQSVALLPYDRAVDLVHTLWSTMFPNPES